jgi:hypothetical protein
VRDSIYGQHDAGWISFYRYFYEVCHLTKETEKINGLWQLAESAGWVLPHAKLCWVSERHHMLSRNDRGRLHSLSGPAIAYPDGWKIYAVNGVRVPEFIVERPHEITLKHIQDEQNAEVRRVIVERYGTSRYLLDAGARIIHADTYGTLYRMEQHGDEPIVMVKVVNATPEPCAKCGGLLTTERSVRSCQCGEPSRFKDYFLRVPPDMTNAQEAIAWTFNLEPEEYHPMFES